MLLVSIPGSLAAAASLVPPSEHIGRAVARKELARALSTLLGREREALAAYDAWLAAGDPDPQSARLGKADLYLRTRDFASAERELRTVLAVTPALPEAQRQLANLLADRGHAAESRHWFERLLANSPTPAADRRLYAAQMQGWGDFRRAIEILEDEIRRLGRRDDLLIELAAAFRGAQRFVESQEVYLDVLRRRPANAEARLGLAESLYMAKDFEAASREAAAFLALRPGDPRGRALLGRAAAARSLRPPAGRAWRAGFLPEPPLPLEPTSASATALSRNAQGLLASGQSAKALETFDRALALDPRFFPAMIGRIEALATEKRFSEALDDIDRLLASFPGNERLELTRARVLSWDRRFDEAETAYRALIAEDPANPVPRLELARVLTWDKRLREATAVYRSTWDPPVDRQLPKREGSANREPFAEYEAQLARFESMPPGPEKDLLARELLPYLASYRIQKSAFLESEAKNLAWNRNFLRAERRLAELAQAEPGNQEAWFDLAQARAIQGQTALAMETYRTLLGLDPLHQQASLALDREELLARPQLSTSYLFLDEQGVGRLSAISRHRVATTLEIPFRRQFALRLSALAWFEVPDGGPVYSAEGAGLEISGTLNQFVSGGAGFNFKAYNQAGIRDTFGGFADLTFNLWDAVSLTLGYEHLDVIHNAFNLFQSTQAHDLFVVVRGLPNHWLDWEGTFLYRFYNDGNEGLFAKLLGGWTVLDHPTTLKLVAGGEFRNTRETGGQIFSGGELSDVIYPYWTPQNYFRGIVSLEWRHDLAREFFANAEAHYYAVRLRGSYDTDQNPSIGFEVEWKIDFATRWSFHLLGGVERSPQWNGANAFATIGYRF